MVAPPRKPREEVGIGTKIHGGSISRTYEVVAGDDGALPACVKTMITIRRETKELFWAEEPVNQTHWLCKDAETKTRKRWIDDSPAQKKMKAREMEIDRRLEKK